MGIGSLVAVWCADVELAVGCRNGTTRWDRRFAVLQSVPLRLELFGLRGQGDHAELTGVAEEVGLDSAATAQGPWRPSISVVVIVPESLDDAAIRIRLETFGASELCSIIALEQARQRQDAAKDVHVPVPDNATSSDEEETTTMSHRTRSREGRLISSSLCQIVASSKNVVAERAQTVMVPAPPQSPTETACGNKAVEVKAADEEKKMLVSMGPQAVKMTSAVKNSQTPDQVEQEQEVADQQLTEQGQQHSAPASENTEKPQEPEMGSQIRSQREIHSIPAQLPQYRPSAQLSFLSREVFIDDLVRLSPTALPKFIRQQRGCLLNAAAVGTVIARGYLPRSMPGLKCEFGATPKQTMQNPPICRVRLLKPRAPHTELDRIYQRTNGTTTHMAVDGAMQHSDQTFWYAAADLVIVERRDATTHVGLM